VRKREDQSVLTRPRRADLVGPQRGRGIGRALWHLMREMGRANVSLMASALAFYGLLSTFPALVVVITSFALLADPGYVQWLMAGLRGIMPAEAWGLVEAELQNLVGAPRPQIGLGLVVSLAIAMWSAHSAAASIMEALNRIYHSHEERTIWAHHGVAFALTIGGLCFGVAALAAVALIPAVLSWLPFTGEFARLLSFARWPMLGLFMMAALVLLYRFAPDRERPQWGRIIIGAAAATVLWLLGSGLFSVYVARFGSYDRTYGSIGAVIVLLMWFYVSAYAALLGALLDAEMGRRAARPQ
jgi:membrane protein